MHRSLRRLILPLLLLGAGCGEKSYVGPCEGEGRPAADEGPVPRLGPPRADVQVEIFVDFACPYSAEAFFALTGLVEELNADAEGKPVALGLRHLPLPSLHVNALSAAHAAAAAHRQGDAAFFAFARLLFAADQGQSHAAIIGYAEEAGLDVARFVADWESPDVAAIVDRDLALAQERGAWYTPTIYVCAEDLGAWLPFAEQTVAAAADSH